MIDFRLNARALLPALLIAATACREPAASTFASRLESASPTTAAAVVGTALPQPFVVRAVDQSGRGVAGVKVSFAVTQGDATVSPTATETDGSGRAQTTVTLGAVAGQVVVTASSLGLQSVDLVIDAQAAALARIVVVPRNRRLASAGDTARFRVSALDAFRNPLPLTGATWTSLDPTLFNVDANGVVTALQAGRTGRLVVSAGGRTDTAWVAVADPSASACLGYGAARNMAIGEVVLADPANVAQCLLGAGPSSQYVAIPVHLSATASSTVGLEAFADGITTAALGAGDAEPRQVGALQRNHAFDTMLRGAGRDVYARRWAESRATREMAGESQAQVYGDPEAVAIGAVGTTVQVNGSSGTSCSAKVMRTARVMAVSQTAVVLADTENPSGGFTEADYQRYAAAFDTLISPVDTDAFGAPTDVDNNGKIVLFFSKVVNELTPRGSSFFVAGFFHPRDVLTTQQCPASNYGEMMYMVVPDPLGQVSGPSGPSRAFSTAFVDSITVATLAHEYQHLINAFRRAYVTDAPEDEVDWLNEGLSHIAEELVFYRSAKLQPRMNLGPEHITSGPVRHAFLTLQKQNFDRLAQYMRAPEQYSPWSGTEIEARGAVWGFLRYAADQRAAANESAAWRALVDSRTSGISNLQAVFGGNVLELERDWLVSNVTDDNAAGVAARYTQPSWNMRALYVTYPLAVRSLQDRTTRTFTLRGGSASYLAFSAPVGTEALVRLTSAFLLPRGNVHFLLARTR